MKWITKNVVWTILLTGTLLFSTALGQSGGDYDLSWYTVDGGGGTSSGGTYTVMGTIGQADAAWSAGGDYELLGGFWPGLVIEYGFEVNFNVIDKTRIGRTIFQYTCTITVKNASSEAIENVELELVDVPDNMTIVDPCVSYAHIIEAWGSATSEDTCIIDVNRVEPINQAEIIWQITYEIAGTGETMQQMSSSVVLLELTGLAKGDITGEGNIDLDDLAQMARDWLESGSPANIYPRPPDSDNIVNFLDFAVLAENWLAGK